MRTPDDTRDDFEDLPILEELRVSLAEAYAREEAPARPARSARRRWGRRSRRLLAASLALLVVVPSAIATRPIWAPSPDRVDPGADRATPAGVILEDGPGRAVPWRLSVELRRGDACATIAAGPTSTSFCKPPGLDLAAQYTEFGRDRYMAGLTSARVAEVHVRPEGGAPAVVLRTEAPDPERLRRAAIPGTFRYFVTGIDGPIDSASAVVLGFDAAGRRVARYTLYGG